MARVWCVHLSSRAELLQAVQVCRSWASVLLLDEVGPDPSLYPYVWGRLSIEACMHVSGVMAAVGGARCARTWPPR